MPYIDTDAFVLSLNTKDFIKDLKNLEDVYDFSIIDENHEFFSNVNKKVMVNLKYQLLKKFGLMNLFV